MKNSNKLQYGFGLVEVMAGLLIGLITTVVIYQVLAVSENYKRYTVGGGETQQNGAIAMYLLERDLRQAGAGLDTSRFGDAIVAAESGRNISFTLAPVVITPGVGSLPDTLTILYGNNVLNGDIKRLAAPGMANATGPFGLTSVYGMRTNDIFIVANAGSSGVMGQISAINGVNVSHDNVSLNGTNFNQNPFPIAYPASASIMNLGSFLPNAASPTSEPALNQYSIAGNQLQITRRLITGTPVAIADKVFTIKAQYGVDTDGDGVIDVYQNTLPGGTTFVNVRAIRVAVLSRLNVFEKTAVSPASIKLWPDAAAPLTTGPVINLTGNDRNYRYRIFTTTIPLRNVIWPGTVIP